MVRVGPLAYFVLGVMAGLLLLSFWRPQRLLPAPTSLRPMPPPAKDKTVGPARPPDRGAPPPSPRSTHPVDSSEDTVHRASPPSSAAAPSPPADNPNPEQDHNHDQDHRPQLDHKDPESLSAAEHEAIRSRFVCHYTPDPRGCPPAHAAVNLFHQHRMRGGLSTDVRESPLDPTILMAACAKEQGLRRLFQILEATHVPSFEGCMALGTQPKGSLPAVGQPLCITPDVLNPAVVRQPFSDYQTAPPYPRPLSALRRRYWRFPGFPFIDGYAPAGSNPPLPPPQPPPC